MDILNEEEKIKENLKEFIRSRLGDVSDDLLDKVISENSNVISTWSYEDFISLIYSIQNIPTLQDVLSEEET